MSSRRKCEKRHIGFLTSIYREGIGQTVCSFAANFADKNFSTVFREKLGMCGGCCDALPASEMGHSRRSRFGRESACPPISDISSGCQIVAMCYEQTSLAAVGEAAVAI